MGVLSPTLLEKIQYGTQGWTDVLKKNAELLEDNLLYLQSMFDVDITSLSDGDILQFNASSGKFENVGYKEVFSTTTTTTTTTIPPTTTTVLASTTTTTTV